MVNDFFDMLKNNFNIVLTEAQKEAVAQKDGNVVLISVPGSGKTTCNVCRCANLILTFGVKPENILSVTFSKAAAIDMENRFDKLFGEIVNGKVKFSTIHSFALKVVNDYCHMNGTHYTIIEGSKGEPDSDDGAEASMGINKISILKRIYYSVNSEYINDDKMDDLLSAIGYASNMMMDDESIRKTDFGVPQFFQVYSRYKSLLIKNNYLDYDLMLTKAYEILKECSGLLRRYRDRYRYIQVDEAQDTSNIQHEIIYLLSGGRNNILFVGDDDQSIYGWRGANPEALLNIGKKYPGAKIIYMEENFRSTGRIVSAANEFIRKNKKRYRKNLYTNNKDGAPISIVKLENEQEQVNYLVSSFKNSGRYSDNAVLFRNNISAVPLADALDKNGIPFYSRDVKQSFFKYWVLQDIVNIFKLGMDDSDFGAFEKVYYKLNSYISKSMVQFVKQYGAGKSVFDTLKGYPGLNQFQVNRFNNLINIFGMIGGYKPKYAIEYFIENKLSYKIYLKDSCEKLGYSMESLNSVLAAIKSIAGSMNTIPEFLERLFFLRDTMDSSRGNRYGNAVVLSTIHSSKGLEYKNVYMIDLIDEEFPTAGSIKNAQQGKLSQIEEERRLFYVGMTRAKDNLTLLTINSKNGETVPRSRFVGEVDSILHPVKSKTSAEGKLKVNRKMGSSLNTAPSYMDYSLLCKGDIVSHAKFGSGPITNIDVKNDLIEINFYSCGKKKLSLSTCRQNNLLLAG